jgi:hypothetical protein
MANVDQRVGPIRRYSRFAGGSAVLASLLERKYAASVKLKATIHQTEHVMAIAARGPGFAFDETLYLDGRTAPSKLDLLGAISLKTRTAWSKDADQVAKTEEENLALCNALVAAEGRLRLTAADTPEHNRPRGIWDRYCCYQDLPASSPQQLHSITSRRDDRRPTSPAAQRRLWSQ